MTESRAVNLRKEPHDVYIGRGSIWGNPFKMNYVKKELIPAERDRVCDAYAEWFWTTTLPSHLPELIGKRLGCYCKGLRCHGDFLASEANKLEQAGYTIKEEESKEELVKVIRNPNKILTYDVQELPETFTVLDFETTGLDSKLDRIVEIGAVRFTRGEPVAIFNTMVRQDPELYPMSQKMIDITGHTSEDIARGMPEDEAICVLFNFMSDENIPLVGQNILFDYSFLTEVCNRLGYNATYDLLDTLSVGRNRKSYPHKLIDLCNHYGVVHGGQHSAYFDALATGEVLLAMHAEDYKYPKGKQVMDYVNIVGYRPKYGVPSWAPDWVTLVPQGAVTVKEGGSK